MVEVVKAKATHWFASRRVSTNTFGLFDAITDDEPLGLPQAVHAPSCQSEPKRRRSPKLSCHRLRLSYSRTSSLTRCAGTAGLSTLTRTPILGLCLCLSSSCFLPPATITTTTTTTSAQSTHHVRHEDHPPCHSEDRRMGSHLILQRGACNRRGERAEDWPYYRVSDSALRTSQHEARVHRSLPLAASLLAECCRSLHFGFLFEITFLS